MPTGVRMMNSETWEKNKNVAAVVDGGGYGEDLTHPAMGGTGKRKKQKEQEQEQAAQRPQLHGYST